ncbi:MAG: DUF1365 domain-containing protein [Verrucomicrobiota bacterium]
MNALYECAVSHCRVKPLRNAFDYGVFMFCVDVEELPKLAREVSVFSHNGFNLFSINDKDHIDLGVGGGIRGNLLAWLKSQGMICPENTKVRLLTFPSVLGYGFNPVSFFYIESIDRELLAVVAEVVNTFREMKLYLLREKGVDGVWKRRVAKDFYVSPFSDPGLEFDFQIGVPDEKWRVNIDEYQGQERVLLSAIRGTRRELNAGTLLWFALKYPLLSVKIIGLIHWHALRLWWKGLPFVRKVERVEAQRDVLRPHSSLK